MTSSPDPADFLSACDAIETHNPAIVAEASRLATTDPIKTARQCFIYVRDEIQHSSDCKLNPVTCDAFEVLQAGTGYCYAKSHLLAALLRANGIPAGLCHQRVAMDSTFTKFCLHGLNAVYLPEIGWYRIDPRGNREGIDAQFTPPNERLAFDLTGPHEYDLPGVFVFPLPDVVQFLKSQDDWASAHSNLPDVSGPEND